MKTFTGSRVSLLPAAFSRYLLALAMLAGSAVTGQEPVKVEGNRTREGVSLARNADPTTGIVRYQGAVYFVKEGRPQRVKGKLELSEGLTVQENGEIIFLTRQSTTIGEGEMFYLNGEVRSISPEMKKAVESFSAAPKDSK